MDAFLNKQNLYYLFLPLCIIFVFFKSFKKPEIVLDKLPEIICTDSSCYGTYFGPEFVNGDDVAHQFSNTMSARVGDRLKLLYKNKKYSKVDFSKIIMTTQGMGSGTVTYFLKIPFIRVEKKCEAFTSFDHCGGWNHSPAILSRKRQLQKALLYGDSLNISPLCTSPEGLQEYWIQWRNKVVQKECKKL